MPNNTDDTLKRDRDYLLEKRRALLVELSAIERYLGLPRSTQPKQERERQSYEQRQQERKRTT
jgi:hypothetical protein